MNSWLIIPYTELTVTVLSPTPSHTLVIDSNPQVSSQTDINDTILNHLNFQWEGSIALDTTTPHEELTFV